MAHGLLSGLRVIEYAGGLSAAYCGKLLADAGAEVLTVEPPGGSAVRRSGPFVHDTPGPERGLPYIYVGANKRAVTLNLDDPQGRAPLLRLLAGADAFVEDAAPGWFATLGIDDAAVCAARCGEPGATGASNATATPDCRAPLVWTSITPFGHSGPYRDLAATALTLQALSGWLGLTGEPEREPLQTGGHLPEFAVGLNAAAGTLGALLNAEPDAEDRGGMPLRVDISMQEAMATLHPPMELRSSYRGGQLVRRNGNRLPSTHPFTVLPCDGGKDFVAVIHLTHAQWEMICHMMGIDHLLENPELRTSAGRVAHADVVDAAMAPWLLARTATDCFHTAQEWRIPLAMVPQAPAIYASPQHSARGFFVEMTHPEAGAYRAAGPAFHPVDAERFPDRTAPALGRDNAAVYGALGLSVAEMAALAARGVL